MWHLVYLSGSRGVRFYRGDVKRVFDGKVTVASRARLERVLGVGFPSRRGKVKAVLVRWERRG